MIYTNKITDVSNEQELDLSKTTSVLNGHSPKMAKGAACLRAQFEQLAAASVHNVEPSIYKYPTLCTLNIFINMMDGLVPDS